MVEVQNEHGYSNEWNDDEFEEVEMGKLRNRGSRFERRGRHNIGGDGDGGMGSIKMSIQTFRYRNDPEANLKWKKKVEITFNAITIRRIGNKACSP